MGYFALTGFWSPSIFKLCNILTLFERQLDLNLDSLNCFSHSICSCTRRAKTCGGITLVIVVLLFMHVCSHCNHLSGTFTNREISLDKTFPPLFVYLGVDTNGIAGVNPKKSSPLQSWLVSFYLDNFYCAPGGADFFQMLLPFHWWAKRKGVSGKIAKTIASALFWLHFWCRLVSNIVATGVVTK